MTKRVIIAVFFAGILFIVAASSDAVPLLITFQGRLTNSAGSPVANGPYFIRFQIYDAGSGGTSLWDSQIRIVQVKEGIYTYVLGQDVPFPAGIFDNDSRWLGITVGADPELTPRKQFLTSPYSVHSQNSDIVPWSGITGIPAGFADGVDDNSGDITAVNTSSGLTGGVTSGDANIAIATGGVTSGHIGDGQITNDDINPSANISPSKVSGTAATIGGSQTFTGSNSFVNTTNHGGTFNDPNGHTGVDITLTNNGGGFIEGLSVGAYGSTGNTTGIYINARSDYDVRRGIYIQAYARTYNLFTGISYGMQSDASDGAWVYGLFGRSWRGIEGRGVYGESRLASYQGIGVHGLGIFNPNLSIGTYGGATESAWGFGVYGEAWANTITNWAAYFGGDVNVTGTLYNPSLVSRIDHPLDPENKYLQHSDVLSPDMINVYTGNIITDGNGDATVVMPDYFAAINSDFRYQLTVIGRFSQAIVSNEIQGNQFSIKTDKPNVKVSWQVTGIRQDKYAQARRVEAEIDKPAYEVGKYLHPEVYGLGHEHSVTAEIRAAAMKAVEENSRIRREEESKRTSKNEK